MATLWIISDQDKKATGQFYIALARALLRQVFALGDLPRVKYHSVGLGLEAYPDDYARRASAWLLQRGFSIGQDRVLLVIDSEETSRLDKREVMIRILEPLSRSLKVDHHSRIHISIVVPMTEAIYLLDDEMFEALARHVSSSRPGKPPRRMKKQLPQVSVELHQVKGLRREAARDPRKRVPKARLIQATEGPRDKAKLASAVAEVVSSRSWQPPSGVVELDRLQGFLRTWQSELG